MRHVRSKGNGRVILVGAGPGRPDLLTLRGAEALARADAVVVDALVDRRVLAHCRAGVEVFDAGKRGQGKVLMRQPEINRLLVRLARAGKRVVRLKGGDPYLFGRGGEEAAWLHDHGVPFEVVPGVSSVLAVPSFAGIPLTHRGLTSTVTVVTGHAGAENSYLRETRRDRAGDAPGVAWEKLDPRNTLVILMGVGRLPGIVERLRAAGWPPATPAAVTQWGSLPAQRTVVGVLGDIARKTAAARLGAPAVIVLGSVVRMRRALNWFERLPLFGKTFLVTRAADQAPALTGLLEARGARVIEAPAIRIEDLPLTAEGRGYMKDLPLYDGVLFTSVNAVRSFAAHFAGPWPPRPRVYAVGPTTAKALADAGIPVHGVGEPFNAEGLSARLKGVRGKRFLLPRAAEGGNALHRDLSRRGGRVDEWVLYRTAPEKLDAGVRREILGGRVDAVAFASGSAVRAFMGAFTARERRKIFGGAGAASIGPATSAALEAFGVRPSVQAREATMESLADALERGRTG